MDLARIALKRLGLIGKSRERNRRPTYEEIDRIVTKLEENPRQLIPVGRIVHFAIVNRTAPATRASVGELRKKLWLQNRQSSLQSSDE